MQWSIILNQTKLVHVDRFGTYIPWGMYVYIYNDKVHGNNITQLSQSASTIIAHLNIIRIYRDNERFVYNKQHIDWTNFFTPKPFNQCG